MSIYTDAGMNKLTGDESWGCVVDEFGNDLIKEYLDLLSDMKVEEEKLPCGTRFVIKVKFNDVASQQNNGGELLALLTGLRIALKKDFFTSIFTDSELLHKWWSVGKVNQKTLAKMDENKKKYIYECIDLRKRFEERGGKVVKISGKDNKADLGLHK